MAQTQYDIIPTQEQLDAIQRELRFHPSTVADPKTLSRAQVDFYNREGYLKGLRIFSPAEMADIRSYFDDLLARTLAAGKDSYSISSAHLKHDRVYDLLTDRRIVSVVQDLLGENIVGWGSHFFCKMPHDGKQVAWHQDASYWPLSPSKTTTVWLAIDDADRENACMQFLPKSHLEGHLPYRVSSQAEGNVLDQTVDGVERFGEPVLDELAAGEISVHSDLLLHGSEANGSDRRRCGLTLRYCAAEVRAGLGWNGKGVVVAGPADDHWANPPRPRED